MPSPGKGHSCLYQETLKEGRNELSKHAPLQAAGGVPWQEVLQGLRCTAVHTGHLTGNGEFQHRGPWLGPVLLLGM